MKHSYNVKWQSIAVFLLLNYGLPASAQMINTATAGFVVNNGSGLVTFNFQNTNASPVTITSIAAPVYSQSPAVFKVWYKSTAISGPPGIVDASNGWTLGGSNPYTSSIGVVNGQTQELVLPTLSIVIPANTTYAMAVSGFIPTVTIGGALGYYSIPSTPANVTISNSGCNILTGANISYAATSEGTSATFTPRGFVGTVNFTVGTASSCATPTALNATSITSTSASLSWTQTGSATNWQIKYGAPGFSPATAGTSIFTNSNPYTLNPPLANATSYDVYVRAVCGAGDTSNWSLVKNFTTLCNPPALLTKKDTARCGSGDVTLEATAVVGASIKWYAASTGGTALFTGSPYIITGLASTVTYYVAAYASATCESARQAVTATIKPYPVVNLGNDTTICPGVAYTFNAGNPGAAYLWSTNATTQTINVNAAGNYSVRVTGTNGCQKSDSITITPGTVPVNVLPATTNLCDVDVATLNAGNAGYSYVWTPGGATTQTITASTADNYSVVIKSNTGCKITSTTQLIIRPLPVANLGNDTSICEGSVIVLDAGNPGYNYTWNTGANTQTINVSDSGTYTVTTTTPYNCSFTEDKIVAFLPSPRVEGFNFIPEFYDELGKVHFSPLNPTNVNSYEWNFGDNTPVSTSVNPTHVYASGGNYDVTLKVFNGCGDYEASQVINVDLPTGTVTLKSSQANIIIFPNPSNTYVSIQNQSADIRMTQIAVFNILGAMVYKQEVTNNASLQRLDVSRFVAGIYSIRIMTDKGFIVKKFEVLK
jgi:hypothetical protein